VTIYKTWKLADKSAIKKSKNKIRQIQKTLIIQDSMFDVQKSSQRNKENIILYHPSIQLAYGLICQN